MLIIGRHGATGLVPKNTRQTLDADQEIVSDILQFEVYLTRDKFPVVIHDQTAKHPDSIPSVISQSLLADLQKKGHSPKIVTLESVLKRYQGKVMLNLELKSFGSGNVVTRLLKDRFAKKPDEWDTVLVSSFTWDELVDARRNSRKVNLALLQSINPFGFLILHRQLDLTAVGFHRLHLNRFALAIAERAKIFTYVYTVNRPDTAKKIAERGVDGIVTDYPERMVSELPD